MDAQVTCNKTKVISSSWKRERVEMSSLEMMELPESWARAQTLKGNAIAQNVLYVEWMKHVLLRAGKMCDVDYNHTLYDKECEIKRNGSKKIVGRGTRTLRNIYILDEIQGEKC